MVMVPDAGNMHFRHSDQQNSSGEDPTQTPRMGFATSVLAGSGSTSTRHGLPPKPKILATPLVYKTKTEIIQKLACDFVSDSFGGAYTCAQNKIASRVLVLFQYWLLRVGSA